MKRLLASMSLMFVSGVWSDTTHQMALEKIYTGPVSSAKALLDLEKEAQTKIVSTCGEQHAYAKKFIVSIPFDTSDFTFKPNGTPGSAKNPVFIYFSYPKVTAQLEFVCEE